MKLTPLDIHHKEFSHSLRGYNEEQVDSFLDEVADELERLFKENIDMSEKLEAAKEKVRGYEQIEASINATLLQAQRSSEDIVTKANTEAESILRDAELKAKEIIHNALQNKQTVTNELVRIKAAEEEFRARYKALLEDKLRNVSEIALPDDVSVLLGDADAGVAGDIAVRAPSAPAPVSVPAPASPAPAPAPAAFEPELAPAVGAPLPEMQLIDPVGTLEQPTIAMPPVEPPASGFVQSVALGELSAPEMEPDTELVVPGDFSLPGFSSFGEREDDTDIEEID
jgi:cell division initiation protein